MTETNKPSKTKMGPLIDLRDKPSHEDTTKDDIETGDVVYTRDAGQNAVTKTRIVEVEGRGSYKVSRFNPYGHWRIVSHSSGKELAEKLKQSYTSLEEAQLSIYRYEGLDR